MLALIKLGVSDLKQGDGNASVIYSMHNYLSFLENYYLFF